MEFPVGLGGVTLVVAALVWLIAFVPGYARKSQIEETSKFVRQQHRESQKAQPLTKDDQLRRLLNTQRGFALVFATALVGALTFGFFALSNPALFWAAGLSGFLAIFSLAVSRAAAKAAGKLAADLHRNRVQVRSKAQRSLSNAQTREWTPNPLPQPLASLPKPEPIEAPIAEVISIDKPRKVFSGSEIDQILARRRAI